MHLILKYFFVVCDEYQNFAVLEKINSERGFLKSERYQIFYVVWELVYE